MGPLSDLLDETGTDRVPQNVIRFFFPTLIPAQAMIEKPLLPDDAVL